MWYIGCKNHIYSDIKRSNNQNIKILLSDKTNSYVLYTNDTKLWGCKFDDRMFVMYTKVRIFQNIPLKLIESFLHHSEFILSGKDFFCKTIGRYIAIINGNKWILDVVFRETFDSSWSQEFKDESILGTTGEYSSWTYDMKDSTMTDFVMEKIEELPYYDRTIHNIIRKIMLGFSSDDDALIKGKWGGNYLGGKEPSSWKSTSHIFREWGKTKKPVKYGQCWVFSECFTCVMRFLNISSRTIYAENSHINISLNGSIDFSEDALPSKSIFYNKLFKKLDNMSDFLDDTEENKGSVDDEISKCSIYNSDDTFWNIHYWNEIYIPRNIEDEMIYSWECLDVTPSIISKDEPYKGKKILGPCKILNIKNGENKIFDFKYLHSSVNSPFRIWTKESVVENGKIIIVAYLKGIVFPFYPEYSIITSNKIKKMLNKQVRLKTLGCDVTDEYKTSFNKIYEYIHKDNPIIFNIKNNNLVFDFNHSLINEYCVQQIAIDMNCNISSIKRQKCRFEYLEVINLPKKTKYVSILVTKELNFWCQLIRV